MVDVRNERLKDWEILRKTVFLGSKLWDGREWLRIVFSGGFKFELRWSIDLYLLLEN
jgi:hypothetical protein